MVTIFLLSQPPVTHPLEVCPNLFISIVCPDILITVLYGLVSYLYGVPPVPSGPAIDLSKSMIDYWVSFATSLDPNDGLGNPRKCLIDHSTHKIKFVFPLSLFFFWNCVMLIINQFSSNIY